MAYSAPVQRSPSSLRASANGEKQRNVRTTIRYGTKQWKALRKQKMQLNPLCECDHCIKNDACLEAQLVHHIIPVEQRPDLLLEMTNLMSVTHECHKRIHKEMGTYAGDT